MSVTTYFKGDNFMDIQGLRRLFDYMYWANCQMWECAIALDDQQLSTDLDYSVGSIHAHLVHMVSMDNLWVNFLWHDEVEFLTERHMPTLAKIREEWDALEDEMRDYLSTLTDQDLEQSITPPFLNLPILKLGDALLQIVNHATDHRAQILAGIHCLGGRTVAEDYERFLGQTPPLTMNVA